MLRGDELNWPRAGKGFYTRLLEQAIASGVDHLVCYLLKPTAAWQNLPPQIQESLEHRSRNAAAVEMARASDLTELNATLVQAGLTALLLKGGALAYTHYPEPHLRTRVDTDIFINPGEIRQVRSLLIKQDYDLIGLAYKSHQFNATRERYGGRVISYDVHWRSNNTSRFARVINYPEAEQESVPIRALGGCRTLNPAHALLLACMHRAATVRKLRARLIWLYDIHLLVSAMPPEEMTHFVNQAVRANIQVICREALEQSHENFATDVPVDALLALAEPTQSAKFSTRYTTTPLALLIDDFKILPDMISRMEFLREFFFPPTDYLLNRYDKKSRYWLFPLYVRYVLGGLFERLSLR